MGKVICSLFILFFAIFSGTAQQETTEDRVKQAFTDYFELPREAIFLHLNKSTYITNENIWFKGYIYNRHLNEPFKETTNVYVGVYDSIGNEVSTKLFLASGGYVKGDIPVDSTWTSGFYYIRASTNWMKNFKEEEAFLTRIKVYNETPIKTKVPKSSTYDVQFLPEGGALITDVLTTLGVKITDEQGYGVKILEGVVRDEKDVYVAQFTTSDLGLGKFNITPDPTREYIAEISFADESKLTFPLPKPRKEGISIAVKNISDEKLSLTLSTNELTREKIGNMPFYLLIHRDGLAKRIKVDFPQTDYETSLVLEKKLLHSGMNIITLFDNMGDPILERLFFNTYFMVPADVHITNQETKSDSLIISVRVSSDEKSVKNLSISVLPKNTQSYNLQDNILSTFYLKPYLKGFIENPSYYFNNMTRRKEFELDLLLLTQGWSKYDWKAILNHPPNQYFKFEQGLEIEGTINSITETEDKILLYLPGNSVSQIIDISQNKFIIPNYFPHIGSKLKFSLIRNNKKLVRPNIGLQITSGHTIDKKIRPSKVKFRKTGTSIEEFLEVPNFILSDNTIKLEEVIVREERKEKLAEKNIYIPRYLKGKVTEVTEDLAFSFPHITDIIRSRGYEVREELSFGSTDRVSIRVRTPQSFGGVSATDANRVYPKPIIYLNDVRLTTFDPLYHFPTEEVESFFIDKTGGGEGVRGAGGVIRIYTRKVGRPASKFGNDQVTVQNIYEYKIVNGFERTKQFYTPRYNTFFDEAFESFGVIHWAPEVLIQENGIATFKILNTTLDHLTFYIEGMGEDGSLISAVRTLNMNEKNN